MDLHSVKQRITTKISSHSPEPKLPLVIDEADAPSLVPVAFKENGEIRYAYLTAVMANVYGHLSWNQATNQLNHSLNMLLIDVLPAFPRPVRALASAKRHLGIDPDQWITQYAICPECWKHHSPSQLKQLLSAECSVPACNGLIYTERRDAKGKMVRTATKINPQVSVIGSLRRMFMRPGFAQSIRDSRQDQPGQNTDEDFVMTDIHHGTQWHDLETNILREVDRAMEGRMVKKLTEHRYGLHLTMNTDWMGILENRPHSTGAIYFAINDLPRDQRFLQINVICGAVLPGPKEPNVQQINHCLEPSTKEMMLLQNGIKMDIIDEDEPANVYADNQILDCDMPAAHKLSGTAGHSHDMHPCLYCDTDITKINTQEGYDYSSWTATDDDHLLRQSFYSRHANPIRQKAILDDHGVRWSTLNLIAGWFPSKKTALGFMHCIFLGIIAHLFMRVLFAGYMFSGAGGRNSPKQRFENLINSVRWPSHITRLPKNLGENQSLKKADEWRRLLTITPVLLWWSWKDENDNIPDTEPPQPPNTHAPEFSRNCRRIYDAVLLLCAAVRLLATRSISMSQARIGQSFLSQYCLHCLELNIHLTINHHASMHIADMIKAYGPVYSWWLFAFERFNGMLERLTLMRHWVQTHLIYEYTLSLPPNTHAIERETLNEILKSQAQQRGSMMTDIAVYQSEAAQDNIRLPLRQAKFINLRTFGPEGVLYPLLISYCRALWPDLNIVDDFSLDNGTVFFASKVARALTYIRKDGIRYGCMTNRRTQTDAYGFISCGGSRLPAEITTLLAVGIQDKVPHVCALIRRLRSDENIPLMPWALYESTLGIHTSYANNYHPYEIIPVSRIASPLALIPVHSNIVKKHLWISVSFDHVQNSVMVSTRRQLTFFVL
ncbi:hypothetical protein EDD22DRAFT_1011418 [Suillus occidentalis]|nr:hypothetical protein EDD22DRAFT_1011418 [Suillus occidentalis]